MAVCSAAEDAISICLNAFSRLLNRFNLTVNQIGRIEVGSESNPDRAKAIKSHLISLLGNVPISGGDHVQACYGGTAALLNAAAWLESSQWEPGKYAVVIAGDVAVYNSGAARATGGAGSIAILLARGCKAPIKLEKKFGHFASHVYDFYKPNPMTEYPKVDGPLSVSAYLQSALSAYSDWHKKETTTSNEVNSKTISDKFDQLIFHSPYSKIIYKACCQLQLFDPALPIKIKNLNEISEEQKAEINEFFNEKVARNLDFSKNLGNSYCASVFFNLLCALTRAQRSIERIGVFSYGSGSMATFFSFRFENSNNDVEWLQSLGTDIKNRLENRIKVTPVEYEKLMESRSEMHGIINWTAKELDFEDFSPGTFYLKQIDSEYRRIYTQKL
jgi:hydroxymethylglutaryl-CoA synthase